MKSTHVAIIELAWHLNNMVNGVSLTNLKILAFILI